MSSSSAIPELDSASHDSLVVAASQLQSEAHAPNALADGASAVTGSADGLPVTTKPRANKRDYQESSETNADPGSGNASPTRPAAKKPTATEREDADRQKHAAAKPKTLIDIDQKHAHDPQYASALAPQVYEFLSLLERLQLRNDGVTLHPAKAYPNLDERRTKCINVMYNMNVMYQDRHHMRVPTDTIHLAIHYIDRFLERYKEEKNLSLALITATALFLASKFEDVEPVDIESVLKAKTFGKDVKIMDVLNLEIKFQEILHVLGAPTATAFAHRYLQAVDLELNLAAVHTARYFCALGTAHFPLTGHYYSKIAAAAVFISYNKYRFQAGSANYANLADQNASLGIEYPEVLEQHSNYSLSDIEEVVKELLYVAKEVETVASIRTTSTYRDRLPVDVYHYYKKANVVGTCVLPNFNAFFAQLKQQQQQQLLDEVASIDDEAEADEAEDSAVVADSIETVTVHGKAVTSFDQVAPEVSDATTSA